MDTDTGYHENGCADMHLAVRYQPCQQTPSDARRMQPNFRSVPDPCLRCAENRGREFCLGRAFLRDAESGDLSEGINYP